MVIPELTTSGRMIMWGNTPHCCCHAIEKYISNGANFYNLGLPCKLFFLLYVYI